MSTDNGEQAAAAAVNIAIAQRSKVAVAPEVESHPETPPSLKGHDEGTGEKLSEHHCRDGKRASRSSPFGTAASRLAASADTANEGEEVDTIDQDEATPGSTKGELYGQNWGSTEDSDQPKPKFPSALPQPAAETAGKHHQSEVPELDKWRREKKGEGVTRRGGS
ncbi:hypothetical protein ACP70R_045172 [Stipagrostis hirtigluma subsp. patula]